MLVRKDSGSITKRCDRRVKDNWWRCLVSFIDVLDDYFKAIRGFEKSHKDQYILVCWPRSLSFSNNFSHALLSDMWLQKTVTVYKKLHLHYKMTLRH